MSIAQEEGKRLEDKGFSKMCYKREYLTKLFFSIIYKFGDDN